MEELLIFLTRDQEKSTPNLNDPREGRPLPCNGLSVVLTVGFASQRFAGWIIIITCDVLTVM
eukprot:scaffold1124_cov361-Prasinococcus_capsulatus_cf.AAC.1